MKNLLIMFVVTISLVAISSKTNAATIRLSGAFNATPPSTPGGPHLLECKPGDTCGWLDDETCMFTDPNNYKWKWVSDPCGAGTPEEIEEVQELLSGGGLEAYPVEEE
jgi:hypothetical protein